jgi:peptidoglycan hydrolase CwlO-like protein
MATDTKHPFSDLSNSELEVKEKTLQRKISKLNSAIEDEREELDRLKSRLRKGDRSVESQIESVKETINDLQASKSQKRARMQKARRMRSSGSSSSAGGPRYSA